MHLSARNLRRSVEGRVLFSGLTLQVGRGERLVVQGASGAGKSQLLRALALLVAPDDGVLTLGGRDPAAWGIPAWRAAVRYVPQRPSLPGSAAAFFAEARGFRERRGVEVDDAEAIAATLGIDAATWRRPWAQLSGGEQQRAAIALAVASRPHVLLLDEPTSALDAEATEAVEALLAGRAAVWVTHDDAQATRLGGRRLRL